MPYVTLADLPKNVQTVLPIHGQEIYLSAFNQAWEQYKDPKRRRDLMSRETTCHKVAWAAVKKKYKKVGDIWQEAVDN